MPRLIEIELNEKGDAHRRCTERAKACEFSGE